MSCGSTSINEPFSKVKQILRKTTAYICHGKVKYHKNGELGPLTYSQAYNSKHAVEEPSTSSLQSRHNNKPVLNVKMRLIKITRRKRVEYYFAIRDSVITWKVNKCLEVDKIKDVRTAAMARNYREQYGLPEEFAEQWLTIIYQDSPNKLKALHLLAPTADDMDAFYRTLMTIVKERRELMESISIPSNEKFANIHWQVHVSLKKEDEDKDTLSFADVKDLCSKFHIYCSTNHLEYLFRQVDVANNGLLNFEDFQKFVLLLKKREEMTDLWKMISRDDKIDFNRFYEFLVNEQYENIEERKAQQIFKKYSINGFMNENMLLKYLSSQPCFKEEHEDYSRPISQYFISSSHNTYLLGSQVGGVASVEGYILALQQGCRSVEIDIWDSDDGPVVCHGRLTSSIPLRNVIEVIRKYAFFSSPYPLIVSLEIHCREEGQQIIRQLFEPLGPLLYVADRGTILPSPMELKHRIILKSKKVKFENTLPLDSSHHSTSSKGSSFESEVELMSSTSSECSSKRKGMRSNIFKRKIVVGEELLNISAIHGIRFRNFSLPESKTPNHCFSIGEKKFDNLCKDKSQNLAINKHNRRYMMRVYPHALRYKSSNFDPTKCWKLGVQMVATNWQTYDVGQQINQAMFRVCDQDDAFWHSGYVRKPAYLLSMVHNTNGIEEIHANVEKSRISFSTVVLSAQLLPKPTTMNINDFHCFAPYVVIEILGDGLVEPVSVTNGVVNSFNQASTKVCGGHGSNPVWRTEIDAVCQDTGFNFIRFTIKNGDVSLATSCVRLDYLKRGYRHLPLYSMEGERYIFSTLFIKFTHG